MPEFDSTTEYLPIPNFPGYVAGSDGSIWSNRTRGAAARYSLLSDQWRKLAFARVCGYWQVTLCGNGRRVCRHVHPLILRAFVGPPAPGHECRHLDGSRTNNRLDNLAWGTRLENNQDKIAHGRSRPGSQNLKAKVNEDQVRELRRLSSEGWTPTALAAKFGISVCTACKIKNRRMWRHVL